METILKKQLIGFTLASIFLTAGVAHFLFEELFTEVIPKVLPFRSLLNQIVGTLEVLLAFLYFSKIQKVAYLLSFILLVVYIWPHVYFIQIGSCTMDFCVNPWISWTRLLIIHPILLYLNYYLIKNE